MHYQPGAEDFARNVAALYPDAIARVEAVHGRRFAHPVTVGAYATAEAYAAANGVGSDIPVGVTFAGRVNLSPKLFRSQRQRLRAILTHELSHAHIQGWIGEYKYVYLPNWFKEGLAVMISDGGGAELVSEDEARAAIQRGERLVINDAVSLPNSIDVRLEKAPANTPPWYPVVLAYRGRNVCDVPSRVGWAGLRPRDERDFGRRRLSGSDDRRLPRAVTLAEVHDVKPRSKMTARGQSRHSERVQPGTYGISTFCGKNRLKQATNLQRGDGTTCICIDPVHQHQIELG